MSITLKFQESAAKPSEPKVHYIPASISGDGKAEVSLYFDNYTTEDAGVGTNALRGFPLKGCALRLPEGKLGVIFKESRQPMTEKSDRVLKYGGQFKEMTYWNYDLNPSDNDGLRKTFNSLEVLKAVHEKVPE